MLIQNLLREEEQKVLGMILKNRSPKVLEYLIEIVEKV